MLIVCVAAATAACGNNGPTATSSPTTGNFTGSWIGNYAVTSCTTSGTIAQASICGSFSSGGPTNFTLDLVQSATTVSGNFLFGTVFFTAIPTIVNADGSLTLLGTSSTGAGGLTIAATWSLSSPVNGQIKGTFTQVWTAPPLTGQTNVTGSITSITQVAATPVRTETDGQRP